MNAHFSLIWTKIHCTYFVSMKVENSLSLQMCPVLDAVSHSYLILEVTLGSGVQLAGLVLGFYHHKIPSIFCRLQYIQSTRHEIQEVYQSVATGKHIFSKIVSAAAKCLNGHPLSAPLDRS